MYTIKQAAARSGVGVSLLRAWERRYGVVVPARTASGYRLYDDASIDRLRAMRQLVDAGHTASQAANAVLSAPISPANPPVSRLGGPGAMGADGAEIEVFLAAAASYDVIGIESSLDACFSRGSFESVIDDRVLPTVAALGTAWASGRIDVAAEHLASAAVQRRLAWLFDVGGAPGARPTVVVGLPPESRHEIGTLAFAVALRRQGVNVVYLGPDVPVSSWVHVVGEHPGSAVVIGVARSADAEPARAVATALLAAMPKIIVAVGGPAASMVAGTGVRLLTERVGRAAQEVAVLLGVR
ncbi:MAG: MerR family transcriptional regulator [Chloroflexota bacterium]